MLIVGLGNPGKQYEKTVHNVGFMAVDLLMDKLGLKAKEKGCQAMYSSSFVKGDKVVIAKPQTYMNLSGESVKQLVGANKIDLEDIVIVYDDIDLPMGTIRIRKEGSAGTHNGMRNIVQELGTTNFKRIRVGVGDERGRMALKDYVLSNIVGEKKQALDKVLTKVVDALLDWLNTRDFDLVMRKYNGVVKVD